MGRSSKQRAALKAKRMVSSDNAKQVFASIAANNREKEAKNIKPIVFQKASAEEIARFDFESSQLIQGTKNKPDFGLNHLKQLGLTVINTSISGNCIFAAKEKSPVNGETYIHATFSLSGLAASIFFTEKTFRLWQSERGNTFLRLIPCVQDRYLNPSRTDWVIPMYEFREGIDSVAA